MSDADPAALERYSRQVLFAGIGEEGQRRILRSRVCLMGCGALGTVLANTLVRAGVGFLRVCDRDFIELNNLQRQILFDESDLEQNLPKAIAAARKLRLINSQVEIDPIVTDVNHTNVERLVTSVDLILDGSDNFELRYLINDVAIKSGTPWVYGAVIGASGLMMPVLPGKTACLRCVFESAPPPEMSPTCDTAGVLGPAVSVVASFQATEAIKLLAGREEEVNRSLASIDLWSGRVVNLQVAAPQAGRTCVCCTERRFEYLEGLVGSTATSLCGRDAVQVNPGPAGDREVSFEAIAAKLSAVASEPVSHNAFMLKAHIGKYILTVFRDGRAIIKGTHDVDEARTVYSKYVGN